MVTATVRAKFSISSIMPTWKSQYMTKCQNCLNGIDSAYTRDVIKVSLKKIG